jgi:hypothetical protein
VLPEVGLAADTAIGMTITATSASTRPSTKILFFIFSPFYKNLR